MEKQNFNLWFIISVLDVLWQGCCYKTGLDNQINIIIIIIVQISILLSIV